MEKTRERERIMHLLEAYHHTNKSLGHAGYNYCPFLNYKHTTYHITASSTQCNHSKINLTFNKVLL